MKKLVLIGLLGLVVNYQAHAMLARATKTVARATKTAPNRDLTIYACCRAAYNALSDKMKYNHNTHKLNDLFSARMGDEINRDKAEKLMTKKLYDLAADYFMRAGMKKEALKASMKVDLKSLALKAEDENKYLKAAVLFDAADMKEDAIRNKSKFYKIYATIRPDMAEALLDVERDERA